MHIEGGRAGGHHSWEDLDDLLLATYAELRKLSNITVCVGGGIGTPERAAEYLSGRWAQAYGFPLMPVDGILVGTAAMATLEATTSPAVKQMLVETNGTDQWISAGKAQGGMASSRSQLGADIHEIDNTASRCGRLLDEVAGDADAVAERRDEIIAAMADTAKPYFGDVGDMTYLQWLQRYVELAIGDGDSTADTSAPGQPVAGRSRWRDRFEEMLKRAEARLHPQDSGPIETLFTSTPKAKRCWRIRSRRSPRCWRATPTPRTIKLHPADVPFFITLCKTLGKPVNFVPVIDKDVRRWWRSDSLWQAHDARYTADQVCIIPGTAGRRRHHPRRRARRRAARPLRAGLHRRGARRAAPSPSPSSRAARRAPTSPVRWPSCSTRPTCCGPAAPRSTRCTASVRRASGRSTKTGQCAHTLPPVRGWSSPATHVVAERAAVRHLDQHPLHAADRHGRRRHAGRHRRGRVGRDACGAGDRRGRRRPRRAAAGGRRQHRPSPCRWDPEEVADHTGVTATFGAPLAPGLTLVPDALVGRCWPAVFSVIGSAVTEAGFPVVEGLLSLVHLDHAAHLLAPMPKTQAELTVTATASAATDTEVGRVVPVSVTHQRCRRHRAGHAEERFAIRGRTGAARARPTRRGPAVRSPTTRPTRRVVAAATSPSPRRPT